ncbi:MAG TPA: GSCFA domain-containing protein [Bacteroidales bacterium]|nr:GSCFA domain-containing protein [Bacteroidales bacterium]
MELRTIVNIEPSAEKISYNDRVMFIGSCFASSIGQQLEMGRMPVLINPSGTVYNPVSVSNTLDTIISGKEFTKDDLYHYDGAWHSFYHYTDFSSDDPAITLGKINSKSKEALDFLKNAGFLFITLGTARVYVWKKTGSVVSNCHKIPASQFEQKLLTVSDIVSLWTNQLDRLNSLFPGLKVIFTISPVRHWKDGAHGNQVSKSVLFLAVEELLRHQISPKYFPAYELVMDDLRDYRFYNEDMLHLSPVAVNYIWNAFSGCYLDDKTLNIWNEVVKITKACNHRINTDSAEKITIFAERMLKQVSAIESIIPLVDLSHERDYFHSLLKR